MSSEVVSLSSVPPGAMVVITALQSPGRFGRGFGGKIGRGRFASGGDRLAALGFVPGSRLLVETNYGYGPVIVRIRGARVAIGRGQAQRLLVRPV